MPFVCPSIARLEQTNRINRLQEQHHLSFAVAAVKNSTALYSLSLTARVDETAASGDDMVDGFVRIILYVCRRQATYIAGGGFQL